MSAPHAPLLAGPITPRDAHLFPPPMLRDFPGPCARAPGSPHHVWYSRMMQRPWGNDGRKYSDAVTKWRKWLGKLDARAVEPISALQHAAPVLLAHAVAKAAPFAVTPRVEVLAAPTLVGAALSISDASGREDTVPPMMTSSTSPGLAMCLDDSRREAVAEPTAPDEALEVPPKPSSPTLPPAKKSPPASPSYGDLKDGLAGRFRTWREDSSAWSRWDYGTARVTGQVQQEGTVTFMVEVNWRRYEGKQWRGRSVVRLDHIDIQLPTAEPPSGRRGQKRPLPRKPTAQRLSLQLYDSYNTVDGALRDLMERQQISPEKADRARYLIGRLFLPAGPDQLRADKDIRPVQLRLEAPHDCAYEAAATHHWREALKTLPDAQPVFIGHDSRCPAVLASEVVFGAAVLPASEHSVVLEPRPPWELHHNPIPVPVRALLSRLSVDTSTASRVSPEALVCAIALSGLGGSADVASSIGSSSIGSSSSSSRRSKSIAPPTPPIIGNPRIWRLPDGQELRIDGPEVSTRLTRAGGQRKNGKTSQAQAANIDAPALYIKQLSPALMAKTAEIVAMLQDGTIMKLLSTSCSGPGNATEGSIMFGVCGGQMRQPGISERIGQYSTKNCATGGLAPKVRLMKLINAYSALVELELEASHPLEFALLRELHTLLAAHKVWQQDDTSFISTIFTNGYVSVGARACGFHTDYRNSCLTHLTSRQIGDWGSERLTGQTVIFDRFATQAVVVDDSPSGRQLVGGLNAFAHANFGPE